MWRPVATSDRSDGVSDANRAFTENLRPESASSREALEHGTVPRQAHKVTARFAQAVSEHSDLTHHERAPGEVIQRNAASHEVSTRVGRVKRQQLLAGERLHRLGLDQRELGVGLVTF